MVKYFQDKNVENKVMMYFGYTGKKLRVTAEEIINNQIKMKKKFKQVPASNIFIHPKLSTDKAVSLQ